MVNSAISTLLWSTFISRYCPLLPLLAHYGTPAPYPIFNSYLVIPCSSVRSGRGLVYYCRKVYPIITINSASHDPHLYYINNLATTPGRHRVSNAVMAKRVIIAVFMAVRPVRYVGGK